MILVVWEYFYEWGTFIYAPALADFAFALPRHSMVASVLLVVWIVARVSALPSMVWMMVSSYGGDDA